MDIVEYLESKGCNVRQGNDNNVHVNCFFCEEEESKRGRLYINIDPNAEIKGLYFCFLCGAKGTFNSILRFFGDDQDRQEDDDDPLPDETFCRILEFAANRYHQNLMTNQTAYKYLVMDRGFTEETIKAFQLGWADGGLISQLLAEGFLLEDIQRTGLVNRFGEDFLIDKITIPYHAYGQVVCIRGKEIGGKYLTPPGQKARLFNSDVTMTHRPTAPQTQTQLTAVEGPGAEVAGRGGPATVVEGGEGAAAELAEPTTDVTGVENIYNIKPLTTDVVEAREERFDKAAQAGLTTPVHEATRLVVCEGEMDCFAGDTEVLTPNGWIRFDQYLPGTPVAQWNKDGSIQIVKPTGFVKKQNSETIELKSSRNGGVSFCVTPTHRMVSVYPDGSGAFIHQANSLPSKKFHIPRVGELDGPGVEFSDAEIQLLMAVQADGTIDYRKYDGRQYVRMGFKKQRKVSRIKTILETLGVDFYCSLQDNGYTSVCFRMPVYLDAFKLFPNEWLSLASLHQRKLILDEMVYWDGNSVPGRKQTEYASSFLHNAVWMQTIAHTSGCVASIINRKNTHGEWRSVHVLHEKKTTCWQSVDSNKSSTQDVYCVQVPSTMLLVRRDHQIAVSGNCISLDQLGFIAVGVPGANTWQESWSSFLRDFRKVYICFDNDEPGRAGAEKLSTKLGPKARIVEMPRGIIGGRKIDVNSWIVEHGKTKDDFEYLFSKAKGGLLVSAREAFLRWKEIEGNPDFKGLKFNIFALDSQMRHGLLPAQVLTMIAKTNCLAGTTDIVINRGGNSKHYSIREVVEKFSSWNNSINPPMTQRLSEDGTIKLVRIKNAWASGVKDVYELSTKEGRVIRATAEHRFLTPYGYRRLNELSIGDRVMVNKGKGGEKSSHKVYYRQKSGLTYHPYATRRKIYTGRLTPGNTVQLHRLVKEAEINHLSLEELVSRCKNGDIESLQFINPKTHVVHHRDGDRQNNTLENLELLTIEEHLKCNHDFGSNVREHGGIDFISSIKFLGKEETYDIEVYDEPHNFVANQFVVHNSGKTIGCINLFHRMSLIQDIRVLYISLEQTRNEWFERAHRINTFYNPEASFEDTVEYWSDKFFMVDKNRLSEDEVVGCIEQFEYEMGELPNVVAVDYLGYYARSFKGEEYARLTNAMMGLKEIAKDYQLVMMTPSQVNRTGQFGKQLSADQAKGSGGIEETSDMVISIINPDQRLEPGVEHSREVHYQVLKSRDGGTGHVAKMQFAPLTLAIVPQDDPVLLSRALKEKMYAQAGDNYEQALERHRTGSEDIFI